MRGKPSPSMDHGKVCGKPVAASAAAIRLVAKGWIRSNAKPYRRNVPRKTDAFGGCLMHCHLNRLHNSFIVPNTFALNILAKPFRTWLMETGSMINILDYSEKSLFKDPQTFLTPISLALRVAIAVARFIKLIHAISNTNIAAIERI